MNTSHSPTRPSLSREGGQTVSCFNALMNTSHSPTRSSLSRRRGSDCILLQCSYEYQPLSYKTILVKRTGSDCILLQCSYEHQPLSYKVILVKKKGVRLYLASMPLSYKMVNRVGRIGLGSTIIGHHCFTSIKLSQGFDFFFSILRMAFFFRWQQCWIANGRRNKELCSHSRKVTFHNSNEHKVE